MLQLLATLQAFVAERFDREEGATAVEYGLMVALIAIVIIAAVTLVGQNLSTVFNNIATALTAVN